ncbi:MAG: CHAT domain-containing protein [Bacteroidales bacterium]|nr:CHAT domain-containing protein [Bacteroidales bacterium]
MRNKTQTQRILIQILLFLFLYQSGITQSSIHPGSAEISVNWFNKGTCHLVSREWTQALEAFRNALQNCPSRDQQVMVHQNLGSLYYLLADYEKAVIHFDFAFQLLNGELTDQSRKAEICLNLGFTWLERDSPDKAQRWFDLAESFSLSDQAHWKLRLALGTGNVLFSKGLYRQASEIYAKAIVLHGMRNPIMEEEIWLLKNLAWSYQVLGELDSAMLILGEILDRTGMTGMTDQFTLGEILLQKGQLLVSADNLSEAKDVLGLALQILNKEVSQIVYSESNPQTLTTTDVLKYRIMSEKIRLEWILFNTVETDSCTVHSLFEDTMDALRLGEDLAGQFPLIDLVALQPQIQRSLTGIALELIMQMDSNSFLHADNFVTLTERLTGFEQRCEAVSFQEIDSTCPDSLKSRLVDLKRQLFRLHKQRLIETPEGLIPSPNQVGEAVVILNELDILDSDKLQGNHSNVMGSELCVIQSLMHRDEVLISYHHLDTSLFTVLLTTDTSIIRKQKAATELTRDINDFSSAMKGLDPMSFFECSYSLYNYLLKPLEEHLKGKFFLRIIPDRPLRELSFEALITNEGRLPETPVKFLIDRFEIAYYTSIQAWSSRRMSPNDSVFQEKYAYDFVACAPEFSGMETACIPHAALEVDRISRLFRSEKKRTKLVSQQELHLDSLTVLGSQSRIFHLATHGYTDFAHPEFSGWLLTEDQGFSRQLTQTERRIELGALQSFRMTSDLVVLSSCSVVGEQGNGWYRMTGFPANFFRAGVHNMLFSLWNVSDKHTDQLMVSFYRMFLEGKSYSAALRAAKLQMLSNPGTDFPFYWGAFVLWAD